MIENNFHNVFGHNYITEISFHTLTKTRLPKINDKTVTEEKKWQEVQAKREQ